MNSFFLHSNSGEWREFSNDLLKIFSILLLYGLFKTQFDLHTNPIKHTNYNFLINIEQNRFETLNFKLRKIITRLEFNRSSTVDLNSHWAHRRLFITNAHHRRIIEMALVNHWCAGNGSGWKKSFAICFRYSGPVKSLWVTDIYLKHICCCY